MTFQFPDEDGASTVGGARRDQWQQRCDLDEVEEPPPEASARRCIVKFHTHVSKLVVAKIERPQRQSSHRLAPCPTSNVEPTLGTRMFRY